MIKKPHFLLFCLIAAVLCFNPVYSLFVVLVGENRFGAIKYLPYLLLVLLLAAALVYRIKLSGIKYLRSSPTVILALLCLIAWSIISFAFSKVGVFQSARGLNVDFAGLILFFVIWLWQPKEISSNRLRWAMFGAIAFLVVLTIPEVINNHAFRIWSHHPLDNHFVAGTVPQLRSLTSGPNPLGTLLSVFAALVVLQVKNTIWRYCLLAVTGIASGLTYARSAWLGTAVMGAGVFIKSLRTKKIIYWPLFLGLFILVGTALGAVRYHTPISDILLHGKSTESHGVTAAKAIQSETKQFALTVVGYGIGTAGPVVYGTPLENTGKYPTITESWYLQLIQEIGLIGIILYGWLYYGLIRSLFKQDSNSIVGWLAIGLAVNAVFLHTWSSDANLNLMFWALAGLTLFSRPTKQLA